MVVFVSFSTMPKAQTIIKPTNDTTFVSEYRDGDEWAVIAKDGFVVGLGNRQVKDDYGSYYQIRVLIQNMTGMPYTFDPDTIKAKLVNKRNKYVQLEIYSNEEYQRKVRIQQTWVAALTGLSAGLNASMAGRQTTYIPTTGYGGYSYMRAVTTYNSNAASQANMIANNQLMIMSKQMEIDRKIREEGYLKKTTIHSGEGIFGYMSIKRKKGKTMSIVIPLNGSDYTFNWNVAVKKKKK
jgi:hypothetical protein